jgi:glycosyltransferase involved in cell wall biosynthesis
MCESTSPIAIFDTSLCFGGFQRDSVNLALGFAALGHRVELILAAKPSDECMWDMPQSARIVELKTSRASGAFFPLVRYLRSSRPRVLISTSTESNLVALAAVRWARERTRVVVRETAIWSIQGDVRLRGKLVRSLARWRYRKERNVVAISTDVQTDLSRSAGLPLSAIRVIYNPAVTPGLLQKRNDPVDHPWFGKDEAPVILSVGRLHAHKDFPALLRSFRVVREQRPARLVILGEGEDRPLLNELANRLGISEDFDLPGFVPNPSSYMSKAAVFVCSSPAESFGNALAEAMACGTPLVSTDCPGGPPEILEHGRYGSLVPLGDTQAMAQAIIRALDRPLHPEVLREAAHRFHCELIAAEYMTLPAFSERG